MNMHCGAVRKRWWYASKYGLANDLGLLTPSVRISKFLLDRPFTRAVRLMRAHPKHTVGYVSIAGLKFQSTSYLIRPRLKRRLFYATPLSKQNLERNQHYITSDLTKTFHSIYSRYAKRYFESEVEVKTNDALNDANALARYGILMTL